MNKLNLKPFMEWFGYSRRERRASFSLIIIIITVAAIRFALPEESTDIEILPVEINEKRIVADSTGLTRPPVIKDERIPARTKKSVNLNACDSAQLESLPGIGPVLAVRIIKYRNLLGGFAFTEQLKEVYGLPAETYSLISERVYVNPEDVRKINVNKATYKQLLRFPYFEQSEVEAILKYRKERGKISGMAELTDNRLISADKIKKVRAYLEFE